MSAISGSGGADFSAAEAAGQFGGTDQSFNDMGSTDFLTLLMEELQNQDPLNPMDNSEMIQQIGLIREIGATDSLSETLSDFSHSQELVTASNLIGQTVRGLADDTSDVEGTVDRVTVSTDPNSGSRSVKVHVGERTMDVKNIREIQTG
ncbi:MULTISPECIES: flagellar hook assembly protein FlgD [Crateriforma]|uniref:Basal-body rod modification protein FlgD n=1 Tax=Crateriforma conspicua TaxID=2527996 RepID=A0A5C6FNU2_9PLAN|nr:MULTISPECIES: flagellar hook capping FlgD N-terminal domain-containing protein [Crateriforma]TWU64792.1 Basal-body rod modification protein FlgD [Crateriforma conspicua]